MSSTVFQSPIALSKEDVVISEICPVIKFQDRISTYAYDPENKEWLVPSAHAPRLQTNEEKFRLVEFHLLQAGEHVINQKKYPLEVRFLFQNREGKFLGLAYPTKVRKKSSPFFQKLIRGQPLQIPSLGDSVYMYTGSSTEPPFPSTINVNWIVTADKHLRITSKALEAFAPQSKPARKIQDRDGRLVCLVYCKPKKQDVWSQLAPSSHVS